MRQNTATVLLCTSSALALRNVQGAPGLSEGQTVYNETLRVELGRTLCQLGKQGLVMPGGPPAILLSAMPPSQLQLDVMKRQPGTHPHVQCMLMWLWCWGLQDTQLRSC